MAAEAVWMHWAWTCGRSCCVSTCRYNTRPEGGSKLCIVPLKDQIPFTAPTTTATKTEVFHLRFADVPSTHSELCSSLGCVTSFVWKQNITPWFKLHVSPQSEREKRTSVFGFPEAQTKHCWRCQTTAVLYIITCSFFFLSVSRRVISLLDAGLSQRTFVPWLRF